MRIDLLTQVEHWHCVIVSYSIQRKKNRSHSQSCSSSEYLGH